MKKKLLITGISGAIAVALGAFGAHGLKSILSEYQLDIFKTGIDYHFIHTLALFGTILLLDRIPSRYLNWAFNSFLFGILAFSGSLYLLACAELLGLSSFKMILGPLTPIGGLGFIIGWIILSFAGYQGIKSKDGLQ